MTAQEAYDLGVAGAIDGAESADSAESELEHAANDDDGLIDWAYDLCGDDTALMAQFLHGWTVKTAELAGAELPDWGTLERWTARLTAGSAF